MRTPRLRTWVRCVINIVAFTLCGLSIEATSFAAELPQRDEVSSFSATPPMGWNSWNKFACNVSEQTIRAAADAIASSGMRDAGYQYVVIDDCWQGPRDADGKITADKATFPSGIRALADYVHSKGLKFGIYSDAGALTCAGRSGSQGHEFQDAVSYASWGVDYLKYDWCSTGTRNAEEAYKVMARALRVSGRQIVFSMCEWGTSKPWLWAAGTGNLWRTTGDIIDHWSGTYGGSHGMIDIVDMNESLWLFAGPNHWNDPDMLEVGNGGMTPDEYRSHFSLWAMMAAPLMAGNDIGAMDATTREILLNREVIAVDQDRLGVQGHRIRKEGDQEVWVRPLSGGGHAVLLLNRASAPATMAVRWEDLQFPARQKGSVRDVWAHRNLSGAGQGVSVTVAPHGVQMLVLS